MTLDQALAQAAALWAAGDTLAAGQLAQQALNAAPDHPVALNLAGCAAFAAGQHGAALALLEKASRLAPHDIAIAGNWARSQAAVGRPESALRRMAYLGTQHPQAAHVAQELMQNMLQSQRPPALTATFYAADAGPLAAQVDGYVQAAAQTAKPRQPKILIAPHAGHVYSGMTAGAAYARLLPFAQTIRRVILLGPAHRVYFQGIALPGVGAFATPLGAMPIDTLAADALADLPWVSTRADAHAQEHSLEVHVPFLQRVLPQAQLLPLLVGDALPEQVAQTIERLWGGDETVIVISTDMSHFHGYAQAHAIDTASCAQVLALDATLTHAQACGATPVNAALQVAKARGMQITQLAQCNSGDTAGDTDRVVGYASFALYAPSGHKTGSKVAINNIATRAIPTSSKDQNVLQNTPGAMPQDLSTEQGAALVQIARAALHDATGAAKEPVPGGRNFTALGASFVTLTQGGQLRGCIGSLQAQRPLADDVRANAQAAALHDSRFAPVTAAEAAGLKVEVSVLTPPEPLPCANESHAIWQLRPGVDGIVLECEHAGRSYRSTYLPQVWEQIPEPRAFMAHLKVKAGLPFDFWSPQMRLSRYRVQKFSE